MCNGSSTLAKFVSETIGDSDTKQCLDHLGWHDTDRIVSISCCAAQGGQFLVSCHPRWSRQVLFCVAVTIIITHTLPMEMSLPKLALNFEAGLLNESLAPALGVIKFKSVRDFGHILL